MLNVLPNTGVPYMNVEINGLTYSYTIEKDPQTDSQVYVRNEDTATSGYIFQETDNWSQTPGGNIQKYMRFGYIDATRWGDGEIVVDGDGTISNPVVTYNYKLEVDQDAFLCYATPLADPSCPGFREALLKLLESQELSPDDPFYDQWVQAQLEREADVDDELPKEKPQEEDLEKRMGGKNTVDAMVDGKQQEALLAALADVQKIESYYQVEIQGGEYQESITLEDTELPDNHRALNNLASDARHRTMVRSQYDREQQEI